MSISDATGDVLAQDGHFPRCGAVPRQALSSGSNLYPSVFQICCLSYSFIKGVQAFCFSSILRYSYLLILLITSVPSPFGYASHLAA
jgi:hypothetical protein